MEECRSEINQAQHKSVVEILIVKMGENNAVKCEDSDLNFHNTVSWYS
jgi:hypothetical protein